MRYLIICTSSRLGGGELILTDRQKTILEMIVDIFTQTHEPVGSKALQKEIRASSATIRNEMSALEKLGLLEKAHTSSGRLPSVSGFKYFVENSLTLEQIQEADVYQVLKALDEDFFKLEDIFQRAADILAEMTGFTAVGLDVEASRQKLTGFEIVPTSAHTALAVFTLDEASILTSQFSIPKNFLPNDLVRLRSLVHDRLLNQKLLDIHYKMRTEIPQVIQRYFTTTDNVLALMEHIFLEIFQEKVFVGGKVSLLSTAGLEAYQFFDNLQAVALELRESLPEDDLQAVRVADSRVACLSQLAVMSQKILVPYRGLGLLAILGPIDMDYKRAVSLLNIVSRVLAMKLVDFYRYLNSNHYEVN